MRYFLGFKPPGFLVDSVLEFRQVYGLVGVEPHITVKAPCGLGASETWLETVRQICQAQPAFPVSLDGVGSFGDTAIFLRAQSPNLISFHQRLIQALSTSATDQELCFEGVRYTPHLSLLHLKPEASVIPHPFSELLAAATERFRKLVVFQPTTLVAYQKEEAGEYQSFLEIPLG
jgi:2'-5' RNA ligase